MDVVFSEVYIFATKSLSLTVLVFTSNTSKTTAVVLA